MKGYTYLRNKWIQFLFYGHKIVFYMESVFYVADGFTRFIPGIGRYKLSSRCFAYYTAGLKH